MRKLDISKLESLSTANEFLDKKYGAKGTDSRDKFDSESSDWYNEQVSGSYRISMPKALHASLQESHKNRSR